jgi:RimJ/RimL family protein N-acetyltransferase
MAQNAWPLYGIRVVTPRLEFRYVNDELGVALAELAMKGIHDPDFMPFAIPWTDAEPDVLKPNTLEYYALCRAETEPGHWVLPFAAIVKNAVVGCVTLTAKDFAILRQFETGSWLGREYQGLGLGREIRESALHLGFAGLSATLALTAAFEDNAPSLGVTRSLGYAPNGSDRKIRRGKPATSLLFSLTSEDWTSRLRRDDIFIEGLAACSRLLGLDLSDKSL